MREIVTQRQLRECRNLPFCYLCGKDFATGERTNRDHVPPEAIFAKEDRNSPLVLVVHAKCNEAQSDDDEFIGQLVAVLHKKYPKPSASRLRAEVFHTNLSATPMLGLSGPQIERIIWRWVRGFHAALYGEFLPLDARTAIHPPVWCAKKKGNELHVRGPFPQESIFAERMKMNRTTRTIDRIISCSGKCTYECTWEHTDGGTPICLFALRLYNWENIGDRANLPQRGCMGCYHPTWGKPNGAASGTRLDFSVPNAFPLDPFAG